MSQYHAPDSLTELTQTQAALRRLAALIAEGVSPAEMFTAVTKEVRRRYGATTARLIRYEIDGTATVLANQGTVGPHVRTGERWTDFPAAGLTETVWRTGRAARVDDYRTVPGGGLYVSEGLLAAVGVPIFVHGGLWGLIAIGSGDGPFPPDAEERLTEFTGLTATAIATAQGRAEIAASRTRIVEASDESRRRIERDLHDGAQQRLVSLAMRLSALSEDDAVSTRLRGDLREISKIVIGVIEDLREIATGIHPAILSKAGLGPALRALARRSAVPTEVRVTLGARLPPAVEVGVYYVASEALANAAKHADAESVTIDVTVEDHMLHLSVSDDGSGGADLAKGTGLVGLQDRVEALGGRLAVVSPEGAGTRVYCVMPLAPPPADDFGVGAPLHR
jgi:signal transduction histidine kinase